MDFTVITSMTEALEGTVDPMRAVMATAIALVAGICVFAGRRLRKNK